MLKLYLWSVLLFLILFGNFGFVLPYLISASHTELVLLGCVLAISTPIILVIIVKHKILPIIKKLIEKTTQGEM